MLYNSRYIIYFSFFVFFCTGQPPATARTSLLYPWYVLTNRTLCETNSSNDAFDGITMQNSGIGSVMWWFGTDISGTAGHGAWCRCQNAGALIAVKAEL